ncbi:MAG: STAS domain-containing protein [Chloroflexota bacterium]|nr:STAS domain-containing protein [Chloroflexota bacterium]
MNVAIEEHHLSARTIRLTGRLEASVVPTLKESFKEMIRSGHCNLILDLSKVSFIDSSGLGMLSSILHATSACGGRLRCVVDADSAILRTLILVRFERVLSIYSTHEEALRSITL